MGYLLDETDGLSHLCSIAPLEEVLYHRLDVATYLLVLMNLFAREILLTPQIIDRIEVEVRYFVQRWIDIAWYGHVKEVALPLWYMYKELLRDNRSKRRGGDEGDRRGRECLRKMIIRVHRGDLMLLCKGHGSLTGTIVDAHHRMLELL